MLFELFYHVIFYVSSIIFFFFIAKSHYSPNKGCLTHQIYASSLSLRVDPTWLWAHMLGERQTDYTYNQYMR